jgi:hemerythrin-like domain-containing protein
MYNTQAYALLYPRKQHIFYENNVLLTFIDVNYGHELYTKKLDIS